MGEHLTVQCDSMHDGVRESLPQLVSIEVGGHYDTTLNVQLQCADAEGLNVSSYRYITRSSVLLGRTGPWGNRPPFAGLHARTIYQNVIPVLYLTLLATADVEDTRLFISGRNSQQKSNNAMLEYFPVFRTIPEYLKVQHEPYNPLCLISRILFSEALNTMEFLGCSESTYRPRRTISVG